MSHVLVAIGTPKMAGVASSLLARQLSIRPKDVQQVRVYDDQLFYQPDSLRTSEPLEAEYYVEAFDENDGYLLLETFIRQQLPADAIVHFVFSDWTHGTRQPNLAEYLSGLGWQRFNFPAKAAPAR